MNRTQLTELAVSVECYLHNGTSVFSRRNTLFLQGLGFLASTVRIMDIDAMAVVHVPGVCSFIEIGGHYWITDMAHRFNVTTCQIITDSVDQMVLKEHARTLGYRLPSFLEGWIDNHVA